MTAILDRSAAVGGAEPRARPSRPKPPAHSPAQKAERTATLAGLLQARAASTPDRPAYLFLADGEEEGARLTWGELDRQARAVAAAVAAVAAPGERALLLYPPGLEFIAAFFGCLYARVVAVPAYPPRPRRDQPRLRAIVRDATPRVALTTGALAATMNAIVAREPDLAALHWLATDGLTAAAGAAPGGARKLACGSDTCAPSSLAPAASRTVLPTLPLDPAAPAFLQYTSGSTALPKGVIVSHANLLHNERMIAAAFGQDEGSVVVGWLPLYHDMGLIGNVLQPLYCGGRCVLMSPAAFLQRPRRWLEAIDRHRATTSGGPNFAYELCAEKIAPRERLGLDLSSWRVAYNGAEPVRAETLDRFAAAFAPSGFDRRAFFPCYGLAEGTLLVTGGRPFEGARTLEVSAEALARHEAVPVEPGEGRRLVGSGRPHLGQEVVIADPATCAELPPGRVGEIWVSGPSVAGGYWGRPEATESEFRATLASGLRPYLRTGDLGFLDGGELFVTGRSKDLIILRGRNHYPQDLELAAERAHAALRPGCGAAFSVDGAGDERLVVVYEVDRHAKASVAQIAGAVRRALAEEHEVQLAELVLIRQGTCPKTSSGKVERHSCRARLLAGGLEVIGRDGLGATVEEREADPGLGTAGDPAAPGRPERVEAFLTAALARVTRVDPARIDRHQAMTAYGLDSLAAVELHNAAEAELGSAPSFAELLEGISLAEAARQILDRPAALEPPAVAHEGVEEGPVALSAGQRALWISHRLDSEGAAYNLAGAARLPFGVDAVALRQAFQALVDRHPVLRTTYAEGPDGPVQRVEAGAQVAFAHFAAASWSGEQLEGRLRHEAFRPFDLTRGPVFRVALFERGPGDPAGDLLVLAVHHIAADFASLAVLARELGALIAGAGAADLGAPPPPYREWMERQEAALAGAHGEALRQRWHERLAGLPALELPTDRPRPAVQSFSGATRHFALDGAAAAALHALAAAHGATFFMVLLAGYQALLARTSGQDDFAVGSPTGNRGAARFDNLVGYLVNPVALRADLAGDPTVAGHLGRVRRTALDALAGAEVPFALLAERLRPERDPSRPPLVQTMLALEQAVAPQLAPLAAFALGLGGVRLDLGGLVLESVALPSPASPFDLSLLAAELPAGLALAFQFNTDLFDGATVARLAGHLEIVLAAMVAEPSARLSDLPLLTAAERHQLVLELGPAGSCATDEDEGDGAPGVTLHGLFEAQAALRPAAVAVDHGGAQLTYGELEARASRLALHLLALMAPSGGAERRVAVSLPRSPAALVALLAVLKAGGVYLPIDPAYPRSRRDHLLGDSRAAVLIAERATAAELPPGLDLALLPVDAAGEATQVRAVSACPAAVLPPQLAYVIYTSGSTGLPKGVEVAHAAAAAHVETARREYGITAADRVLQFAAAGFDVALEQVFATWAAGAVLVLRGEEPWSPAELSAGLARLGVTVANLPTAYWHGWLREVAAAPSALRLVIAGGEAMPPEAARLASRTGAAGAHLINAYGPTETVMTASLFPVTAAPGPTAVAVPVGRPLARRSAFVADHQGRLLPLGVPGELLLGGLLARGYLGRPELSAERFIPHAWAPAAPGARLYKSGDLARFLPTGDLEILGRIDRQVKVRGFRIELGEIEAALARHPAVGECAVLVREDRPGERRLVAYVVGGVGSVCDGGDGARELREFLAARLPEPTVPGIFVFLKALPLTAHGKVDHRALPAPAAAPATASPAAPRGAVEQRLAAIWCDVLRLPEVGVDDNFFALGGDSILGLQILSRTAEAGISLSLRQIFRHPTIAELAVLAELETAATEPAAAPAGEAGEVPLTPIERWFFDQELPRPEHWGWSAARLLAVDRMPAPGLFERALAALSRHHDALRLRFVREEGGWRQLYAAEDAGPPLTRVDLSGLAADARTGALAALGAAAQASLDLSRGPLLRAVLFDLGAGRPGRLLLVVHHLVMDGVSWRIALEDLATACRQLEAGEAVHLPAKTASFGRFARRLAEHAGGDAVRAELPYWRAQGARTAPLPLDFPRRDGDNREASAATVRCSLGPTTTRALLGAAHQAYGTRVDDLLRTALVKAFSRFTGRRRLLVDLEGHGREGLFPDLDLSRTVGWLTALHRVRLDLGGAHGTGQELTAIKEQGRAIPWGGVGYGVLRYLAGERLGEGLGEPQAEVLFNYLGRAEGAGAGGPWAPAAESSGPAVDPAGRRSHLLVVNCWVASGRLEVEWSYSRDLHLRATVERLADGFLGELAALVEHCLEPEAGAWSPSDFPDAGLGERELGNLLLKIGGSERGALR